MLLCQLGFHRYPCDKWGMRGRVFSQAKLPVKTIAQLSTIVIAGSGGRADREVDKGKPKRCLMWTLPFRPAHP